MNSILSRVMTASVLSLGVFGASQYLSERIRPKIKEETSQKAIAVIEDLNNGAEKRTTGSLVWKVISLGESLQPGEAVKTLESGEARIRFHMSSKYIELEPESLIIMTQEKDREISLELMSGSALVAQNESLAKDNEPLLTVKSDQGKLDLSEATAHLSKSRSGDLDVQVIKGKIKTENAKPLASVQILSPPLVKPLVLSSSEAGPVHFEWQGFPPLSKITVALGKLKKNLTEIGSTEKNYWDATLEPGNYFWRLTAQDLKSGKVLRETALFRLKILPPKERKIAEAPLPSAPTIPISWDDEAMPSVQHFVEAPKVSFSWSTEQKNQVEKWRLTLVEKEEDLKNPKAFLAVKETKEFSMQIPVPKAGRYIAQIEALNEKNQVLAVSALRSVDVSPLPLLKAPEFTPLTGELNATVDGRLDLQWTPNPQAREYLLTLMDAKGLKIRKAKYKGSSTALLNLLPGDYQISIQAVDSFGRMSELAPPRQIVVPDHSGLQAPKLMKIQVGR